MSKIGTVLYCPQPIIPILISETTHTTSKKTLLKSKQLNSKINAASA
jgi:hypothetical protein